MKFENLSSSLHLVGKYEVANFEFELCELQKFTNLEKFAINLPINLGVINAPTVRVLSFSVLHFTKNCMFTPIRYVFIEFAGVHKVQTDLKVQSQT